MSRTVKAAILGIVGILVAIALIQPNFFGESEASRQESLPLADGSAPVTTSAASQAHQEAGIGTTADASTAPAAEVTPPTAVQETLAELSARIEADPTDADAWMALGTMLAVAQDYARASEAFAAAVDVRPDDAVARAELGRALLYQGLLRVARRELLVALTLDPTLVEANLLLGVTYSHTAPPDIEAARVAWERTIELDPDSEFAKQAAAYLEAYVAEAESTAEAGPTATPTPDAAAGS